MKYLLAIIGDETHGARQARGDAGEHEAPGTPSPPRRSTAAPTSAARACSRATTATTLRRQGDDHLITDGPFAETKEQLGGYYLSTARTSTRPSPGPRSCRCADGAAVEVRPVMDYEAAGSTAHSQSGASA